VRQDQLADSGALGDAADLRDVGVQPGHPVQGRPGEAVTGQVAEVGDLMDENVGAAGERDQVLAHGRVAGEDHRAVGGVEPVPEGRDSVPVGDGNRGDPDIGVLEDDGRNLPAVISVPRPEVIPADQLSRIRHRGVQRHHVEVVCVGGQDD
jgi:hypothetical protein